MSPLLGPILAQLVTLGVSDRTEVRHIASDINYSEVATLPRAGLDFGWKHTRLSLGYGPSITVTPLQAENPNVLIFHAAAIALSQRWQRTTLTLSESAGYGRVNFRSQALAGAGTGPVVTTPTPTPGAAPPPPATGGVPGMLPAPGTPGTTGANTLQGFDRPLTFVSSVTSLTLNQVVSPVLTLTGGVSYLVSGAVGAGQSAFYPTVRGPGAQASVTYGLTRNDRLSTGAFTQLATASTGNRAWLLSVTEAWTHRLGRATNGSLGSGLSITRNSQPDGLIYYSVYPNFLASIASSSRLGRSTVTFGGGVSSTPYIDPVRAAVDPRLSANVFTGLGRDKFSTSLSGSTGLAIATAGSTGALNSVSGAFNVSYRLGAAMSLDSGVRSAWQSFQGGTTVPISFAFYAGVSFGLALPLTGQPH